MICAEPPEDEQRGREHAHRQREDEDERNEEPDGLGDRLETGLAIDEQGEDFLENIAEQENESKDQHRHQQSPKHLPSEIEMQSLHAGARSQTVGAPSKSGRFTMSRVGRPASKAISRVSDRESRWATIVCSSWRVLGGREGSQEKWRRGRGFGIAG